MTAEIKVEAYSKLVLTEKKFVSRRRQIHRKKLVLIKPRPWIILNNKLLGQILKKY